MAIDLPANSGMKLHDMVQAIVTVLAVINPVVCGSIFLTLTPELAPAQKRGAAVKVALSILIILVVSALIGLKVLSIFGISLDVFRIVGGMIIAYMGFDMLRGRCGRPAVVRTTGRSVIEQTGSRHGSLKRRSAQFGWPAAIARAAGGHWTTVQ